MQTLRAQVQELIVSVCGVVEGQVHFPSAHARMDGHGPDAPRLQVLHLVFHEGDERCNYQGDAVLHEGRHLETDALATAGRENSQHVLPVQCLRNDLLLHRPEGLIAPVFL